MLLRLAYLGVTNAFAMLRLLTMSDWDKDVEILALRHQITVLERQLGKEKVRFDASDRAFLAVLLHRLPRDVLRRLRLLVRPDTVLRWHPRCHRRIRPNAIVGRYQARAMPVADTDPATPLTDQVRLVPGTYEFIVRAPGHGHVRVGPITIKAGQVRDLPVTLPVNLASAAAGAVISGDGVNLAKLADDDEATNWASLGSPVAGRQVTVDLTGGAQQVRRVQVSAMLRPAISGDPDAGTQSRFSALRQFRVLACTATGTVTCSDPADFRPVYTSRQTRSRRWRHAPGRRS
ncbi:carboxypeptidase-like regulatory domain-containing protein [Micromonospora sp. RTP1Z1]|uniref:carboxypeptidase-like regulatory domain-containing protein n=1 Tax=Micromonospora sp. RTP1Z1 TaxID=2994043 RepID=UPI0029C7C40A|nr:carboxypeptidase-like regulatory domain-containing protein [Micromonospora sp. RTP1Z1]